MAGLGEEMLLSSMNIQKDTGRRGDTGDYNATGRESLLHEAKNSRGSSPLAKPSKPLCASSPALIENQGHTDGRLPVCIINGSLAR